MKSFSIDCLVSLLKIDWLIYSFAAVYNVNFDSANRSYALYVVPDTEEVRHFTAQMNETWVKSGKFPHFDPSFHTGLDFVYLKDEKELEQYNTMNDNDNPVHLAIVFDADPLTNM